MSGLGKRMRRKLLLEAARLQRAASAGGGQHRKPLNAWVWSTKADLVDAAQQAQRQADTPPEAP